MEVSDLATAYIAVRTVPKKTSFEGSNVCKKSAIVKLRCQRYGVCASPSRWKLRSKGAVQNRSFVWFGGSCQTSALRAQLEMTASLKKYDTVFPADAAEFCPHLLAQDILVCGTYKLLEERDRAGKQQRIGRCSFLSVSSGGDLCDSIQNNWSTS